MTGDPGGSPDPLWVACGPIFRKNAGHGSCRMSALDMQYKEKRIFYAVVLLCVSPPVWPCERLCALLRGGTASLPLPAVSGQSLGRCSASAETACFLPPGRFPRDERSSRRKNRRFCGAGSLTTARSAGSCGVLKGRCSVHGIVAMTPFSVKFSCLLRAAKNGRGVLGYCGTNTVLKNCAA